MRNFIFYLVLLIIVSYGYQLKPKQEKSTANISEEIWGKSNGKIVKLITLTNKNGMAIKVTNFGACLTDVSVPDRNGIFEHVVLGFDSLKNYMGDRGQHGKTIGRFANRIGGAEFNLNGTTYKLTANNGNNSIHGGPDGFSNQVFDIDTTYTNADSAVVSLHYKSADMEEGFPGKLTLILNFVLTADNEIKLEYEAETDKPTVVNFTNHSYFNLTGCKDSVLNHQLMVASDSITPTASNGLPTGMLLSVSGTAYDFNTATKIADKINELPRGYDINYKLRKKENELSLAAEAFDPVSGRLLQAYTTEPGMQLYTDNFSFQPVTGHDGMKYRQHFGLCLEMQHFPDSPNNPQFPSTILNPGEKYRQVTIYKFSTIPL